LRASYAIDKGIIEVVAGGIFNKFMQSRLKRRRNTLFFEDVVASYIKECESAGHGEEMYELGREWFRLIFRNLFTKETRALPWNISMNGIVAAAWKTLGVLDDLHVEKEGDTLIGVAVNESVTSAIGKNMFCAGLVTGIYEVVFDKKVRYLRHRVEGKKSIYHHVIQDESPTSYPSKSKDEYDLLNRLDPVEGFSLQDALQKGIFVMKGNRLYFRNKRLWQVENTLFHLFGKRKILFDRVPVLSQAFFKEILGKDSSGDERLNLLKTLLQVMGWGAVRITYGQKERIVVEIRHPPRGFQQFNDDYGFLARFILGFMQNINPAFGLSEWRMAGNAVRMEYYADKERSNATKTRVTSPLRI